MYLQSGEREHGSQLLQHAVRAAQVIQGQIEQLPRGETPAQRSKLQALNQAIDEVKAQTGEAL
jgi:hypothetical protein